MRIWSTDVVAGESSVGAGGGTDGIETVQLANFTADPANGAAVDVWRSNPGILRANLALSVLPETEMDEALKSRLMGECYFLRAHYYFILVRFFGDVPLRIKPLFATDDLNIGRTPKEQVYEQIIADTREAISRLPYKAQYGARDLGRACKEAAECMLAKVFLTLGTNYAEVVSLCQDIENQGYDLSKMAYADNWYNPETGKLNQNGPCCARPRGQHQLAQRQRQPVSVAQLLHGAPQLQYGGRRRLWLAARHPGIRGRLRARRPPQGRDHLL